MTYQTTPATPARFRNAPLLGAFMFAHFTHHVSNSMLTPLLPVVRSGLGLTYAQSGFLVSAFTVSQGLSQLPIGALADRFPTRTVIAVGLVATAACMVAMGFAADYWQLLLALVGLGLVAGSYHAPAAKALAQVFDKQRLGAALGLHTTGGTEGVGRATTRAVVWACVLILVLDFFITKTLIAVGFF